MRDIKQIMKRNAPLVTLALAIVVCVGIIWVFTHNSTDVSKANLNTKSTVSSQVDVKVKDIIANEQQTQSSASSETETQRLKLDGNLSKYKLKTNSAVPKDVRPSQSSSQQGTHIEMPPEISVNNIKTDNQIRVKKGEGFGINIQVEPTNATNKDVTWKSSDNKIAKVDATGMVIAENVGNCTITVVSTQNSKISAAISVTVYEEADN